MTVCECLVLLMHEHERHNPMTPPADATLRHADRSNDIKTSMF